MSKYVQVPGCDPCPRPDICGSYFRCVSVKIELSTSVTSAIESLEQMQAKISELDEARSLETENPNGHVLQ